MNSQLKPVPHFAREVGKDVMGEIQPRLEHEIDAVLDGGDCGVDPTTLVDLSVTPPAIVREGKGALAPVIGGRD